MPKVGLKASALAGDVHLADISVPPSLYVDLGLGVVGPVFAHSQILRVRLPG